MFVIGVRYLNNWAMATHPADYREPEWPPHPDRVFMALVAAHFESSSDSTQREAIQWLERQGPPELLVTPANHRSTVTTFVPVNDRGDPVKKGRALMPGGSMPIGRDRQARQFPVAIPHDPTIYLVWRDVDLPNEHLQALSDLCGQITCIGHSASLVQVWIGEVPIKSSDSIHITLRPVEVGGEYRLRVFGPGRLQSLKRYYAAGLRPVPSLWMGYGPAVDPKPEDDLARSHFNTSVLLLRQTGGKRFGLESTLQLTTALRATVMQNAKQPPPSWISGHNEDGSPAERAMGHIAFFPIPHVGRQHADGHLMGLGIASPRDIQESEVGRHLHSLLFKSTGEPKPIRLVMGRWGDCVLEVVEWEDHRLALQPETWTQPSRRWATVTPIALDRHAKGKNPQAQIEEFIAEGCVRIGLPRPSEVIATTTPILAGVPHAREMPRISRKHDGGQIRQTHAVLIFREQVQGPLLIGAGRYRGYGLCRPFHEGD